MSPENCVDTLNGIADLNGVVYAFHGFSTGTCVFAKSPALRETIVRL